MSNKIDEFRTWCDAHIAEDIAEQLDIGTASGAELFKTMAGQGFLLGDKGPAGLEDLAAMTEEAGYRSGVLVNALAVNLASATLLGQFGHTGHQQKAAAILSGKATAAFLMTEEFAGSDVAAIRSTATEQADGRWQISGEKWFATGAEEADWLLVVARSGDGDAKQAMSVFCVPRDAAGLRVEPMPKAASLGFASCYVTLDQVMVDADAVVGRPARAWRSMAVTGGLERLLIAASCVGLSRHMLDFAEDHAGQRTVQGKPVLAFQAIAHSLADMRTKVHAASLMVADAVGKMAAGTNAAQEVCMAKLFASEMQQEVSLGVMKILGGRAYLTNNPVQRWQREGQLSLYAGGTNEVQRNLISGAGKKA